MRSFRLFLLILLVAGLAIQSAGSAAAQALPTAASQPCSSPCADKQGSPDRHCLPCSQMIGCRAHAGCGAPCALAPAGKDEGDVPRLEAGYARLVSAVLSSRPVKPEQHPPS